MVTSEYVCLRLSARQENEGTFWISGNALDLDLPGGSVSVEDCVDAPMSALEISMLCLTQTACQNMHAEIL